MSWRKQEAFKVNTSTSSDKPFNNSIHRPYHAEREKVFKYVETDTLKTDAIEASMLLMNSKHMMITTDRMNINTTDNSLNIPTKGPIKINNILEVDKSNITIKSDLKIEKTLNFGVNKHLVQRLILEPRIVMDIDDYTVCNHFIIDCNEEHAKGEIYMMPYHSYTGNKPKPGTDYLYIIHFCISANKGTLVDVDFVLDDQNITIKMISRASSFSLLWSPEGRWLIHSLGYKTKLIDTE